MYLLSIIIILIIIAFYINHNQEDFTTSHTENKHVSFGRRPNGIDLLDDSLFNKVVTYQNDDDPYSPGQHLGIDKCLDKCDGVCIEYGITGIGLCFPAEQ